MNPHETSTEPVEGRGIADGNQGIVPLEDGLRRRVEDQTVDECICKYHARLSGKVKRSLGWTPHVVLEKEPKRNHKKEPGTHL